MGGKGKVTNIQFTKASDLTGSQPATKVELSRLKKIFYRLQSEDKGDITVVFSINGKLVGENHHTLETDSKFEDAYFNIAQKFIREGQNAFQFKYGNKFPRGYNDESAYYPECDVFTVEVMKPKQKEE